MVKGGLHYLNGQWLEAENLKVSAFDVGLTRGIAVFDLLRTYGTVPFRLQQHLDRLRRSAEEAGLELKETDTELKELVTEGVFKNKLDDTVIRIMLTGGVTKGLDSAGDPTLIITFVPLRLPSPEQYEQGVRLMPYRELRVIPESKTTNYLMARRGLLTAKQQGYDDVLYVNSEDQVLEATINNIFFIKGNKIITPDTGQILPGITREAIIEAIRGSGEFTLEERGVTLEEAKRSDEAFLTGTLTGVMAVREIDGANFEVNSDKIIQITRLFNSLIARETDVKP